MNGVIRKVPRKIRVNIRSFLRTVLMQISSNMVMDGGREGDDVVKSKERCERSGGEKKPMVVGPAEKNSPADRLRQASALRWFP